MLLFALAIGASAQDQTPPPPQSNPSGGDNKVASAPIPKGAGADATLLSPPLGFDWAGGVGVWSCAEAPIARAKSSIGKTEITL